ncbi:MAG: serine/threonine-protein kinase [Candidatus Xenobia bacterium]
MAALCSLILLCLLALPAHAAPARVQFDIWPPPSTFTDPGDGVYAVSSAGNQYLGSPPAVVTLKLPDNYGRGQFIFRHAHCEAQFREIGIADLQSMGGGVYRYAITLPADSGLWALWFTIESHAVPCVLALLFLAAVAAVAAVKWRQSRVLHERLEDLEALATSDANLGRIIGGYRLLEALGEGASGAVYRAQRDGAPESVAIKVMKGARFATEEEHRRFVREVRLGQRLSHPGLVHLMDFGELDTLSYLVMELVSGETLEKRLERGSIPLSEFFPLFDRILDAVAYAHGLGIVHRDLKPANIMIDREGKPRVMDFGIARAVDVSRITATGMVPGTLAYAAPEQLGGSDVTALSDQYSLGLIGIEMLAGQRTWIGEMPTEAVYLGRITGQPIPSVRESCPKIPEQLAAILEKMVASGPTARHVDLQAVRTAMREEALGWITE